MTYLWNAVVFLYCFIITITIWLPINSFQYRRGTGVAFIALYIYYLVSVWYQDRDIIHGYSGDHDKSKTLKYVNYPYLPPYKLMLKLVDKFAELDLMFDKFGENYTSTTSGH